MYGKLLKYYLEQQRWTRLLADEIRHRQTQKFRQLFEFARIHSSFYHKIYQEAGVENLEIRTFEDIQKVPVVDKAMMRAYAPEEVMTRPVTPDLVQLTTSGSTGEPFKIYQTKYEQYTAHLRVLGMLKALGYRPWHQILMLWRLESNAVLPIERDLSLLTRLRKSFKLFRRDILSVYAQPEEVVEWIQARPKAEVFWSTPGIMAILCDHLESRHITFHFNQTILTSETLSPQQRQRFAACMGGHVVSLYGCMECPTIGFDAGIDDRQRIFTNACMMELLNIEERGGVSQGEPVITNLVNGTMPFIRYNTHDSAVALDNPECPTKIIGPICGRLDDVLTLPGGGKFAHHHAYALFMDFTECMQYKFVQTRDGQITLRLKMHDGMEKSLVREKALARWHQRYPTEPLQIEFVETMPIDSKTGKFKNIERL
jgi:phenylacetate-CoA ligase